MCFPLHRKKLQKEEQLLGKKINLYTELEVSWNFTTAIAACEIRSYIEIHFKINDLENVCQGHDVQHSQWRHSIANDNVYKSRI